MKVRSKQIRMLALLLALAAAMPLMVGADRLAGEVETIEIEPVIEHAPQYSLPLDRIALVADGETREFTADITTVDELLAVAGIKLGEYDVVRPSLGSKLSGGEEVVVMRASVRVVTVTEELGYSTKWVPNEYIPRGEQNLISEGECGERIVSYEIVSINGRDFGFGEVREQITREPVAEVVEYGPGGSFVAEDGSVVNWSYKIDGNATAYSTEGLRVKNNAIGNVAREGTVAVDPKLIPLRSELYIKSRDDIGVEWDYGYCTAEDTGGAVKGAVVDLFFDTFAECYQFGRRYCTIYVIEEA